MAASSRPKAIKYLSNKELLAEIGRCKLSYCSFTDKKYSEYDAIISTLASATPLYISELLDRLNSKLEDDQEPKTEDHLVFRVMTYDHIPLDPERKRKSRATNQSHARTNFPPFKHYLREVSNGEVIWTEVGRSHWEGDFETGHFTIDKGRMSERLGMMFMMLVEKYSSRANWRNYCVDETTEALTDRGWVLGSDLAEDDLLLSYEDGKMKWSEIKSIYRGNHDGKMYRINGNIDALVTEGHKFVTEVGIKPVEELLLNDRMVLMGQPLESKGVTPNAFIQPDVELSMDYVHSLSSRQREMLIRLLMMGQKSYQHSDKAVSDIFSILCSLSGIRTLTELIDNQYSTTLLDNSANIILVDDLQITTETYNGSVWCPETEFGCFVVRRNGYVYLTGNSYRDEMRGLALMHLAQVGLQFDESKSSNPFAFFTTTISHCFCRTLLLEKKNQSIRDDLLVHNGMTPSSTRQIDNEMIQSGLVEPKKLPTKRGRKSAVELEAIRLAEEAARLNKE